jgi:hypothetical protein
LALERLENADQFGGIRQVIEHGALVFGAQKVLGRRRDYRARVRKPQEQNRQHAMLASQIEQRLPISNVPGKQIDPPNIGGPPDYRA